MGTFLRRSPALLLAGLIALCLSSSNWAGEEPKKEEKPKQKAHHKQLHDTLKTVINQGADYFNDQGDANGCARLFEGALIVLRPLVGDVPGLQKEIDDGLASARAIGNPADRAFALRKVLDSTRARLRPTAVVKDKTPPDKTPPDKTPPDKTPVTKKSLWERLGGLDGVEKVVDDFIVTASNDKKVDFSRGGKYNPDVKKLRKDLIDFISQNTDGPYRYTGRSMKEVHKDMKITNKEFNASVADLKKALEKNGAGADEVKEVLKLVNSTRKQIVDPATEVKKPDDKKPVDKKPDDKKPVDKKIDDKKIDDKKTDDKKPVDKKIDDKKTDDKKAPDTKVDDNKGPDTKKAPDTKVEDKKAPDTKVENKDKKVPDPETKKAPDTKVEDKKSTEKPASASGIVQGKVTYKGKALPAGTITFVMDNRSASAAIHADGTYELKQLPAGESKIAVQAAVNPAPNPAPKGGVELPKGPGAAPAVVVVIPARFRDANSSGLRYTVRPGNNPPVDIDLPD